MVARTTDVETTDAAETDPVTLIARIGTFYLTTPDDQDVGDLIRRMCTELGRDNRVLSTDEPRIEPEWDHVVRFFPMDTVDSTEILLGLDVAMHVRMARSMSFRIRVPKKNQPGFRGLDDIPTDEYCVTWNGGTLIVFWEQPLSKPVPAAGGHVVEDILRSAAKAAGGGIYVQACSVGCDFMFFHTTIRLIQNDGTSDWEFKPAVGDGRVVLAEGTHTTVRSASMTDSFFQAVSPSADAFAEMRNTGARIQLLENRARSELGELLVATAQREHMATHGPVSILIRPWKTRGYGRKARETLALLWIAVANLEMLNRAWHEEKFRFTDSISKLIGLDLIFEVEINPEAEAVATLDLGTIQAAVAHLSGGLDTRTIVVATLVGAIAGGLAGALISLL